MPISISRRHLAASGALLMALPTRAALARQGTPVAGADGLQPDGTWQFTDDRGETIAFSGMPTRIVAQTTSAAGLWDFGVRPIGIFGPAEGIEGNPDPATGNIDLDQVAWLGDFGEMDLEQLIELDAQIYVDINRGVTPFWYLDEELLARVEELVETISIDAIDTTVKRSIQRFEELAAALGADLTVPEVASAKASFETSEAELIAIAESKPELRILFMTGDPTSGAYFVNPEVTFDLLYYRELGLNLVQPESPDPSTGGNFEIVSWEQLGKYPADVILYDDRYDVTTLSGDPLWDMLPAVQAGQVGAWTVTFPLSWSGLNAALTGMIEVLGEAEPVGA